MFGLSRKTAAIAVALLCLSAGTAGAKMSTNTVMTAKRLAFGLACSVQAGDQARAQAWAQSLMATAAAMAQRDTVMLEEFSSLVYATGRDLAKEGRALDCAPFPAFP